MKCNIEVENATIRQRMSSTSMCNIFSAKKNIKGQNTRVMTFNSRQLIHGPKIEIVALK